MNDKHKLTKLIRSRPDLFKELIIEERNTEYVFWIINSEYSIQPYDKRKYRSLFWRVLREEDEFMNHSWFLDQINSFTGEQFLSYDEVRLDDIIADLPPGAQEFFCFNILNF